MPTIDLGKVVGPKGDKGDTGPQGMQGIQGIQGQTGPGVVPGGAENSILAKNSSVDYDTKWMTMSQVGTELVKPDNPVGVALSGKASNPNLLDDWYFVGGGSQQGGGQFPINQRGETEYTGTGYTIDRWKFDANGTTLSIYEDHVSLSFASNSWWKSFVQVLEGFSDPIQLTVSIMYRSSNPPHFIIMDNFLPVSTEWTVASYTGIFTPDSDRKLYIRSFLSYGESEIDVKAVKLELGSVQTLAHQDASGNWVLNDPPPNFQQELAKCQRYQVELIKSRYAHIGLGFASTTVAHFVVPLSVPMRVSPTITAHGIAVSDGVKVWKSDTTITLEELATTSITLRADITDTGLEQNHLVSLQPRSESSSLFLNANL